MKIILMLSLIALTSCTSPQAQRLGVAAIRGAVAGAIDEAGNIAAEESQQRHRPSK